MIRAWRAGTGLTVYDGYGQTETTIVVANVPGMEVRPGSMGRPMAGWDVTVRREDGSPAPVGEVGEVCIAYQPERPVGLYDGYRGDEGRRPTLSVTASTTRVTRRPWTRMATSGSRAARPGAALRRMLRRLPSARPGRRRPLRRTGRAPGPRP